MTDGQRNSACSDALTQAIEQLETARSPETLGPAFAMVTQARTQLHTTSRLLRLTEFSMSAVAVGAVLLLGNVVPRTFWFAYFAFAVPLIALRLWFLRSGYSAKLARMDKALARWVHVVPLMQTQPDSILKDKRREPA